MGLLHIYMANDTYDLQRVTSPPPMDEIARLIAGTPEVVYALLKGKRCQMFINADGQSLELPVNVRAMKLYNAWLKSQGKVDPIQIRGNAVVLNGLSMEMPWSGG